MRRDPLTPYRRVLVEPRLYVVSITSSAAGHWMRSERIDRAKTTVLTNPDVVDGLPFEPDDVIVFAPGWRQHRRAGLLLDRILDGVAKREEKPTLIDLQTLEMAVRADRSRQHSPSYAGPARLYTTLPVPTEAY